MSEGLQHIEKIAGLVVKYNRDNITEQEHRELMAWCDLSDANRQLFERLSNPNYLKDKLDELPKIHSLKQEGWAKVMTAISAEGEESYADFIIPTRTRTWRRYAVAASVVAVLAVGAWFYIKYSSVAKTNTLPALASNFKNDVKPGGDKAVLTLSDGSTIVLDRTGNGTVARQGSTKIVKLDKGQLTYKSVDENSGQITYNTLTTPADGQFSVALPDGSKVWLNNASSPRYPVALASKTREVELKGETYFEIARNAAQPFKVPVGSMLVDVDVLGTSFNIAAYGDESHIKTNLLTGGVRMSEDADGVVAWKNGLFHFERADINTVMRMLARWYDVDVVYEGQVSNHRFGGNIQRNLNLTEVLEILQKNQVHFSTEVKVIAVLNKALKPIRSL